MKPNPVNTMMSTMGKYNFPVELKRKMPDGTYHNAPEESLESIGSQARVASVAQALQNLTVDQKTEWAISMKNKANVLYENEEYKEAIDLYVEALVASNFSKSSSLSDENIDNMMVPVLCNLAACCTKLQEWKKVVKFCDQCLELRPLCSKALMRRCYANYKLGEFEYAEIDVRKVLPLLSNQEEKQKAINLQKNVKYKLYLQSKAMKEQKEALRRRFTVDPKSVTGTTSISTKSAEDTKKKLLIKKNISGSDLSLISVVMIVVLIIGTMYLMGELTWRYFEE